MNKVANLPANGSPWPRLTNRSASSTARLKKSISVNRYFAMIRTAKFVLSKMTRCTMLPLLLMLAFSPKCNAQATINPHTKNVQISIHGVSEPDISKIDGIYSLSSSGEITLPRIGKVKISGWGYAELSLAIQKAYRDSGSLPNVEVNAWGWDGCCFGAEPCIDISGDLWVGRLSIPIRFGKMKLAEALNSMRPKDSANLLEIEISRDGKRIVVDATRKEGLDTELKNHDIITVPSKNRDSPSPSQAK